MKWLILIIACYSLLLSSCFLGSSVLFLESDTKDQVNLVGNSDFEKADKENSTYPADWLLVSNSNEKVEPVCLDSTVFLTGHHSLRITNNARDMLIVSDAFKINFTGGFFSKCSMKSAKPMQKAAKVYFWAYNDAGSKKNSFGKSLKTKGDWKQANISAGFLHDSVTFARIAIYIPRDTDNSVWIDGIGCYQVYQFTRE